MGVCLGEVRARTRVWVGGAHGEEDLNGVVTADGEEVDAVVVVACADDVDVRAVSVADVHGWWWWLCRELGEDAYRR